VTYIVNNDAISSDVKKTLEIILLFVCFSSRFKKDSVPAHSVLMNNIHYKCLRLNCHFLFHHLHETP
jgi:hypothetical protein